MEAALACLARLDAAQSSNVGEVPFPFAFSSRLTRSRLRSCLYALHSPRNARAQVSAAVAAQLGVRLEAVQGLVSDEAMFLRGRMREMQVGR